MKCPHCQVNVHFIEITRQGVQAERVWYITGEKCPHCEKLVIFLSDEAILDINREYPFSRPRSASGPNLYLVWPRHAHFTPAPPEIPPELAEDYNEACTILDLSPKASAALARRCLQNLLREHIKVKPGNLSDEIQAVLDSK
jgi:hypothetical protein